MRELAGREAVASASAKRSWYWAKLGVAGPVRLAAAQAPDGDHRALEGRAELREWPRRGPRSRGSVMQRSRNRLGAGLSLGAGERARARAARACRSARTRTMARDDRERREGDRPPECGAVGARGGLEAVRADERALEHDREDGRADRAADPLENVQLRRRVGELGRAAATRRPQSSPA